MTMMVETPDWGPLESLLGTPLCDEFMWMGQRDDIQLYKHRATRRYLNLDGKGRAYFYDACNNIYARIPLGQALAIMWRLGDRRA